MVTSVTSHSDMSEFTKSKIPPYCLLIGFQHSSLVKNREQLNESDLMVIWTIIWCPKIYILTHLLLEKMAFGRIVWQSVSSTRKFSAFRKGKICPFMFSPSLSSHDYCLDESWNSRSTYCILWKIECIPQETRYEIVRLENRAKLLYQVSGVFFFF